MVFNMVPLAECLEAMAAYKADPIKETVLFAHVDPEA